MSEQMPDGWEEEARAVSAVALATSIAAMAMQVLGQSGTRPADDKSMRALLRRVAPPGVSEFVITAAEGLVTHALMEIEMLRGNSSPKQ